MTFKGLDFLPHGTKLPFAPYHKFGIIVSGILIALSLMLFVRVGLNYGIDFRGGMFIEVQSKSGPADISQIRSKTGTLGLGEVQVQGHGLPKDVLIRVERQAGGEIAQKEAVKKVHGAIVDMVDYQRAGIIGPIVVSGKPKQFNTIAVFIAVMAVLLFSCLGFEFSKCRYRSEGP